MADKENGQLSESNESDENKQYDPRLDFFSAQFDPILALRTPGLKIPDKNAKKYDNLAAYDSATLREKCPQENASRKKRVVVEESSKVERKWLPHQMPIKSSVVHNTRNVLTRMENIKGPLALLRKCKDERLKIKVWTRHDKGIRGYCIGYVVVFDKHWNLVLEEVTEFWTRPKKRKVPAYDSVPKEAKLISRQKPPRITITNHPTNKTLENCARSVGQFMIRGEHIVFINVLNKDSDNNTKSESDSSKHNFVNIVYSTDKKSILPK